MKKAFLLLLVLTLLLLVTAGCGGESAAPEEGGGSESGIGVPVTKAESTACAANRSAIQSAAQQYKLMEGKPPASVQQLVPKYLQKAPTCPEGGSYSISGDRVVCSVHGS